MTRFKRWLGYGAIVACLLALADRGAVSQLNPGLYTDAIGVVHFFNSSLTGPVLGGCAAPANCQVGQGQAIALNGAVVPGGPAGGDLGGTYPNPTVTGGTHLSGSLASGLTIPAPVLSGTVSGTYSLGGTLTISAGGTLSGSFAGNPTFTGVPIIQTPNINGLGRPAVVNCGNPAGTTSATFVQMGCSSGTTKITPTGSGNILALITGTINSPAAQTGNIEVTFGTGNGPANAAAVTGTVCGPPQSVTAAAGIDVPFTAVCYISGATIATGLWVDPALDATGAVSVAITSVNMRLIEL